jgi:hypothetical protein
MPSRLLRAELEQRDYNFPAPTVELFVEKHLNGCCDAGDAIRQVQKWQVQKLQAEARSRTKATLRAARSSGQREAAPETTRRREGTEGQAARSVGQGCVLCGEMDHSTTGCPLGAGALASEYSARPDQPGGSSAPPLSSGRSGLVQAGPLETTGPFG